ncbi:hypothetical protein AGDE_14243 [Angomonas deanei]|uniref:Uncharacterized protein n=1 Tax=Angomonas deanei TaxID=59799 RepID=A0A7G2C3K9_9TRYP|nr:hypothetical protein AGDE_14243 [Angomonas deanei]CAD2214296.1 hypothetical protein, conserved [Angomonas deanei]|eukprot:EPY21179.1 hypothetical protein AGDE_14243 [Angomonas deanei]
MALRDNAVVDSLLSLLDRFISYVENDQKNPLTFLMRRNTTEIKDHTVTAFTMELFNALHLLVVKRLRSGVAGSGRRYKNPNAELIDRMKCLVVLQKRTFDQLNLLGDNQKVHEDSFVRESTWKWLLT